MKFLIKNFKFQKFRENSQLPLSLSSNKKIIATKKNNLTDLPSFVIYHAFRSEEETSKFRRTNFASNLSKTRRGCVRLSIFQAPSGKFEPARDVHLRARKNRRGNERKGRGWRIPRSNERENAVARATSVLDPGQLILDGRVATFRFPETHGSPPRS